MSTHSFPSSSQRLSDADLILVNQDLAGFFTSIDQDRFIGAWLMLLDFLRPHMDVSDNEAFSVYPGKTNNPGDIIKGRTFRRLNVTRKIIIRDVPDLLRSALNMQTFALGHQFNVFNSVVAAPWAVHSHRHSASWLYPLANKSGPSTSNKSFPISQSQLIHSPHSLCGQPPHLWGLSPSRPPTI